MSKKLCKATQIAKSAAQVCLLSVSTVSAAFAAEAAHSPIDPSTLALFAIGLASLVATRKRVR